MADKKYKEEKDQLSHIHYPGQISICLISYLGEGKHHDEAEACKDELP